MIWLRPRRWNTRQGLAVAVGLLGIFGSGCLPAGAEFDFGLGTSLVSGIVAGPAEGERVEDPLVVVLKYHHTFIETPGGVIRRPTAHVVSLDEGGGYNVGMPSDVVEMELLFLGANRLSDTLHVRRQIGVGTIRYRAILQPMTHWRSHYFTFIEPRVQNLITELRYGLSPDGQQRLGQWLMRQKSRVNTESVEKDTSSTPAAAPPRP